MKHPSSLILTLLVISTIASAQELTSTHYTANGEYYGEPVESVPLEMDSPFCPDDHGNIGPQELLEGPNCFLRENGNPVFDSKPITALGLVKGQLALTIDDGPNPNITLPMLDLLDSYGIKATFFMVGKQVLNHPEVVREVARRGHLVANHSYDHNVAGITSSTIVSQVLGADKALRQALGANMPSQLLFRAPGLAWNQSKAINLNDNGTTRKYIGPIHANLGTDAPAADWSCWGKGVSAEKCADMYFQQIVKTGRGVILAHDIFYKSGRPNSFQMLKILLSRLDNEAGGVRRNGTGPGVWQFVSLNGLESLKKYDVDGVNLDGAKQPDQVLRASDPDEVDALGRVVIHQFAANYNVRSSLLESANPSAKLDNSTLVGIAGNTSQALKTEHLIAVADTGESIVRGGATFRKVILLDTHLVEMKQYIGITLYISERAL